MNKTAATPRGDTIFLLAAIAALGSLATQMIVPLLPLLAHDLAIGRGEAQRVVAVYLVGMAAGQLLVGPLFDRQDRKTVVLGGLSLFACGSLLAGMATSYPLLLAARLVQAVGAAVGIVGARVLIGDLFPPEETTRRQSTLMAFVLTSPALAPVLGGAIGELAGWRPIMLVLAAGGLVALGWAMRSLPALARPALRPERNFGRDLLKLLGNRCFRAATLAIAGGSSTLYAFLTVAPFLLAHDFALSPREVGAGLMLIALSSIAGTFAVGPADRKGRALLAGAALILLGPLLLAGAVLAGLHSLAAFLAPMCVLGLGAGMCGPAGIARVLRSQSGLEGTSAALCGALQMAASGTCAGLVGLAGVHTVGTLAAALAVPAALGLVGAVIDARS